MAVPIRVKKLFLLKRRPAMSNAPLTPAQQELLSFFTPGEVPTIHRQLKEVFRVAAFESQIAENEGGKDSLFTLYHLIELIEELKTPNR